MYTLWDAITEDIPSEYYPLEDHIDWVGSEDIRFSSYDFIRYSKQYPFDRYVPYSSDYPIAKDLVIVLQDGCWVSLTRKIMYDSNVGEPIYYYYFKDNRVPQCPGRVSDVILSYSDDDAAVDSPLNNDCLLYLIDGAPR